MASRICRTLALLGTAVCFSCTSPTTVVRDLTGVRKDATIVVRTQAGQEFYVSGFEIHDSTLVARDVFGYRGTRDSLLRVPLHDVTYLAVLERSAWANIAAAGLGLGLLVLVASAATHGGDPTVQSSSTKLPGCCPFLYTLDRRGATFVSESFAGAVFRGAERTGYATLDGFAPDSMVCRLRLTNERVETDYINSVALTAVDAPAGARVLTDDAGGIHALLVPRAPVRAVDAVGRDVRALLDAADGRMWESDLDARDVRTPAGCRDTLTLAFVRTSGMPAARLAVAGVNTSLGVLAFQRLLGMAGDSLLAFLDHAEHDSATRTLFRRFLARAGMLHVAVRERTGWREQTAIADVGPVLPTERAACLDLSRVDGDTVQVRLTCTTDLWRIDRVAFDDAPEPPLTRTPLPLAIARRHTGADVAALLAGNDSLYLTTFPGDTVELAFHDTDRRPQGGERHYILATRGFYHLWIAPADTARLEQLTSILRAPERAAPVVLTEWKRMPR